MHIPVLQKEIIQYLDPKPNENFIDCTTGEGGHTAAVLEKTSPKGRILGIEADTELYQKLKSRMAEFPISNLQFSKRLILANDNFANLREIVKREKLGSIHGILFDLGLSSWHLAEAGRGFTFLKRESLDMRYTPRNPLTAEKILNYWSVQEIERILREYGEERFAREIAEKIVEARKLKPIQNTFQLVEIIKAALPARYLHKKLHPATKTFQALRIAVNDELNNLEKALPQALEILKTGGRIAVISFHSLEDRIVKDFCRDRVSTQELRVLTKKPITPSKKEIKINPRSRSAKLRAAIKIFLPTPGVG